MKFVAVFQLILMIACIIIFDSLVARAIFITGCATIIMIGCAAEYVADTIKEYALWRRG